MLVGTSVIDDAHLIEASVLINGVPQPLYFDRATNRHYVAATVGAAYTLQVRNLHSGRIEVINTVDGRNTLEDEPGDIRHNTGLVFASYSTGAFSGYRINDNETREFVFGEPEHSMAVQATGSASNVGVIGFAVYREQVQQPAATRGVGLMYGGEAMRGGGLESLGTRSGGGVGTSMGALQQDAVGRTRFERQGLASQLVIGYDTEEQLRARGIIAPGLPDAFPGVQTGYATRPSVR